ncbi:MAG: YdeI/OmpD-associated family protein [Alphaproteobacteria bacterium]|nr:YdeI/OmpD-associated family protein [Alphaproteobacteria bacterium]
MALGKANPKVDAYLERQDRWRAEMTAMREIARQSGLVEDFKWGHPCYTLDGRNVVLIHGFKDYCAFLFMKGALMADPSGILVQQTENVQAARHVRFKSLAEVEAAASVLAAYIEAAIAVERSGKPMPKKATEDFAVPEELTARFETDPAYGEAFAALTPGRQRAYLLHFAGARQAKTRAARIDKHRERILEGLGLTD